MALSRGDNIKMARAKVIEGLASLDAAAEFWPDASSEDTMEQWKEYQRRVAELRRWIFDESLLA